MKNLVRVLLIASLITMSFAAYGGVVSSTFANNRVANWTTYRSQRFRFSIKYPSTWRAEGENGEHNPVVIIYPRRPRPHEFYVTVAIENRTLDQVRETFAEFTRTSPTSRFEEREILFANKRAYQFTRSDNPGFYAVYVRLSDKMYVVSAVRFDIADVRRCLRTFRLI
jgi:hypothetical protein